MESRIEKYKEYRKSIVNTPVTVPVLKTPNNTAGFEEEKALYNKIVLNKRILDSLIVIAIIAIITLLVVFGIKVF